MPGVENLTSNYSNDYTAGAKLYITVTMPAASDVQIADVARRMNDLKGTDFDGYTQTTEFVLGNRIKAEFADVLNPAQIADRSRRLRQIGSALPTADIAWFGGLDLRNSPPVAESLAAVRIGLGTVPAQVVISPADRSPMWTVDFPFNAQREENVQRQLSGLPLGLRAVTVKSGALSFMSVTVQDPKTAYQDLTRVIERVRPGPEHPVTLYWIGPEAKYGGLKFNGSVHLSGCQYPRNAGEEEPQKYLTPEAIELQRRLREEFDTCK